MTREAKAKQVYPGHQGGRRISRVLPWYVFSQWPVVGWHVQVGVSVLN